MAKAKPGMRKIVAPVTIVVSAGKNRTREVPPGTEVELPEDEACQIEAAFASNAAVGPALKPGEATASGACVEALENALAALADRVAALEAANAAPPEPSGDAGAPGAGETSAAG